MWVSTIGFDSLQDRGRWKVEFFCSPEDMQGEGMVSIGSIVKERKDSVNPLTFGDSLINYIGLENVQSLTGELVDFSPRSALEIKSRSKVFQENDVLFGRLRPNLNKVWIARGEITAGICSTEFLVLMPDRTKVLPMVLRYLLSSNYVQRHAMRLLTGTALPRMNRDDLFEIEVPVPSMKIQEELEIQLQRQFDELVQLRKQIHALPQSILQDFLSVAESATPQ